MLMATASLNRMVKQRYSRQVGSDVLILYSCYSLTTPKKSTKTRCCEGCEGGHCLCGLHSRLVLLVELKWFVVSANPAKLQAQILRNPCPFAQNKVFAILTKAHPHANPYFLPLALLTSWTENLQLVKFDQHPFVLGIIYGNVGGLWFCLAVKSSR